MHTIFFFSSVPSKSFLDTIIDVGTLIALIISIITLWYSIHQSKLAKKSVELAEKSIKIADTNRQLELLPNYNKIIEVNVHLELWQEDLKKQIDTLKNILSEHDYTLIESLNLKFGSPEDVRLRIDEKTPIWLQTIVVSGAQYYFDAMAALHSTFNSEGEIYKKDDCITSLLERFDDSHLAILELRKLLKNTIPKVILEAPASVNASRFFKE